MTTLGLSESAAAAKAGFGRCLLLTGSELDEM
jgi:hypothetical protein